MSWYVEYLLSNRDKIRDSIVIRVDAIPDDALYETYMPMLDLYPASCNLDDDVYLDLLTVESELSRLDRLGLIEKKDMFIVNKIISGLLHYDIEKQFNIDRHIIRLTFKKICDRIALSLGDYFTDDGFFEYMCEKYELNHIEEEKLRKIIFGRKNEF